MKNNKFSYPFKNNWPSFRFVMFWAAVIGLAGGFMVAAYFEVMNQFVHLVWTLFRNLITFFLPSRFPGWTAMLMITTLGGLLVGLATRIVGRCGEISAVVNNINMKDGKLDIKMTPPMIVISLISIAFGGSAGPEAPLVQIVGSFGSWLSSKLTSFNDLIRTFTFCGMGAALGALFGSPLGGALFSLEIPHRSGLEYYEALIPSIFAALISYGVFKILLGYNGFVFHFTKIPDYTRVDFIWCLLIGVTGAIAAGLFAFLFRKIESFAKKLRNHIILLASCGGFLIGALELLLPANFPITSLFWGEYQLQSIVNSKSILLHHYSIIVAVLLLILLSVIKMLAVGLTLHSGFRGGFIFPLFFIGGTLGLALHLATKQVIPLPLAILCMMASVNIAVTKTPISTGIILAGISGVTMLPLVALSGFISFLVTTNVNLIKTQRHREQPSVEQTKYLSL